jgi:deferrochelatase/peroxidase EfeB
MSDQLITITIPFKSDLAARVEHELSTRWGNPAHAAKTKPSADRRIADALDELAFVHFMGIHAVPGDPGRKHHLVIELAVDGDTSTALQRFAQVLGEPLCALLGAAGLRHRRNLARYLERHRRDLGPGWFSVTGVGFRGTPTYRVQRIRAEAKLAQHIADLLESAALHPGALATLERVRERLSGDAELKWAFEAEPVLSDEPQGEILNGLMRSGWPAIRDLYWPALIPPALGFAFGSLFGGPIPGLGLASAVALAEAGLGVYIYLRFREQERTDPEDLEPASPEALAKLLEREDHGAQNHLLVLTPLKPGMLRRFTLRIAFFVAQQATQLVFPQGKLQDISTIHVARWIVLPGSSQLLFMSNYGGSWGSYLEDFIIKAHTGLTGVWSNTQGFPRASNLFFDGSTAGSQFKTWARRNQPLTRCWYSAYPSLSTARIRTNALIRSGLATAQTEAEAARWLSLFGARKPEQAKPIDPGQAPALVYGGMGRLRHGKNVFVRFADQAQALQFLRQLEPLVGFGERGGRNDLISIGFSAAGLQTLGMSERELHTFPVAFQHDSARRARILGDVAADAPEHWSWGGPAHCAVHAVVILLADSETRLAELDQLIGEHEFEFRHDVAFENTNVGTEAFGFADGVSQPILGGTSRAAKLKHRDQTLAPGEFVLGYADETAMVPPSPKVSAAVDPTGVLPELYASDDMRDLGRNGTFLVVRQLEQLTDAFDAFIEQAGARLSHLAPEFPKEHLKEWAAAKMVGRWRNGTSLVRHPKTPGPDDAQDNDFMYGLEDPDGVACPLGSHVRRANPRDSFDPKAPKPLEVVNRHRILRVGRRYVEGKTKGLMFMCLNADIERQFEFVQQTWLQARSFMGLADEADPVISRRVPTVDADGNTSNENTILTIPTELGPVALKGFTDFVRVHGSGYFFMPSRQALRFFARSTQKVQNVVVRLAQPRAAE